MAKNPARTPAKPAKGRTRPELREAIRSMVWEGTSPPRAAEIGSMTLHSLQCALRKPHVKALYADEFRQLRENAAPQAYANIVQMGHTSRSEDVRFRANQWVAGVDGISPATKVQHTGTIAHKFEGFDYAGITIDGTTTPGDEG